MSMDWTPTEQGDPDKVDRVSRRFIDQKALTKASVAQEDTLKSMLKSLIADYGTPDENGHVWVPGRDYLVKHERRTTTGFDREKATKYLMEQDAWEAGTVEVPAHRELTEDSFMGYLYEHTDEDPADFMKASVNWAVKVTKEAQADY